MSSPPGTGASQVRLLVVDDHALFRAGLISLLNGMEDFQVVGQAGDGQAALEQARRLQPDVILLDVNMPNMNGVQTVEALRGHPSTAGLRVVMLTISKSEDDLFGAIAAGADGYLLKNAEPDDLRKAILMVHQGMSVLSPQVTRRVLQAVTSGNGPASDNSALSGRELDVLRCLAQGKTTLQVATELYISENTVKTHVRHILEKLEASNRTEAVRKAVQMGWIVEE